jgi:predicted acylesterase/phospholipase RssA
MNPRGEDVEREVRVALVLYGGVSLAIYENGVTRCFDQLVRGEGVFRIVLDLLRGRAAVDVIAGTSAGGINGLILAACLESGADFKSTARLWRKLGDFGRLLRDTRDADRAESLLDGEGYYHHELLEAFQGLCAPQEGWESPGEIDLFITGTDLDGHERRYQDGLGAEISDKEHRLVFHLKHRPGRAWLGLKGEKKAKDVGTQAAILAAVARITSSFPVAFPPFRTGQLDEHGDTVAEALRYLSDVGEMNRRSLVDGGVLDNKPFGPVLNAIFYRMPTMPVERRLFYVEPDPVPFIKRVDPGRPPSVATLPPSHSPFQVAGASLTTIPAHEGIAADLELLIEHNQRIAWLRALQEDVRSHTPAKAGEPASELYRRTRLESLARLLVLETDAAPSARDYPKDEPRRALLVRLQRTLGGALEGQPLAFLDKFDAGFQQRIAFHLLYALYEALEHDPSRDDLRLAMWRAGRIVKILEIVFVAMISMRKQLVAHALEGPVGDDCVWRIVDAFCRLLDADAEHWKPLLPELERLGTADATSVATANTERARQSLILTEVLMGAREAAGGILYRDMTTSPKLEATTILERVLETLDRIADSCRGDTDDAFRLDRWIALDCALYPIGFSSGIHELDEIQFVRVSPADARIGLSARDAHAKVAGDELAHFSSFLRRDWRSNDLLYGQLDGICQIVRSLLDDDALLRASRRERATHAPALPETGHLHTLLPQCSEAGRQALRAAWNELREETRRFDEAHGPDASDAGGAEGWREAADRFRTALIVAGQQDAFHTDFEGVLADHYFQEIAYGRQHGPGGTTSESSETAIEGDAGALARRDRDIPGDPWQRFVDMGLGSQPVTGGRGGVPNDVVAEYVTAVYLLLWGLLKRSFGDRGSLLDLARVRFLFRTPVAFFHHLFSSLRHDRKTALVSSLVGLGILIGLGWAAWMFGQWWLLAAAVIVALIGFALLAPETRLRARRRRSSSATPTR